MTDAEIVVLCRYVKSLAPAQKFDHATPDAWADVFRGHKLTIDQAKRAASAVARRQQWISPADILAEHRAATRPALPPVPPRIPPERLPDPARIREILASVRTQLQGARTS